MSVFPPTAYPQSDSTLPLDLRPMAAAFHFEQQDGGATEFRLAKLEAIDEPELDFIDAVNDAPLILDHRKKRRNRTTLSCLACHQNKRKCDRGRPCRRCKQLNLTGLCVYEVEDTSRDVPGQDEVTKLRGRVAELEEVIREIKKKPQPRWAAAAIQHRNSYSSQLAHSQDSLMANGNGIHHHQPPQLSAESWHLRSSESKSSAAGSPNSRSASQSSPKKRKFSDTSEESASDDVASGSGSGSENVDSDPMRSHPQTVSYSTSPPRRMSYDYPEARSHSRSPVTPSTPTRPHTQSPPHHHPVIYIPPPSANSPHHAVSPSTASPYYPPPPSTGVSDTTSIYQIPVGYGDDDSPNEGSPGPEVTPTSTMILPSGPGNTSGPTAAAPTPSPTPRCNCLLNHDTCGAVAELLNKLNHTLEVLERVPEHNSTGHNPSAAQCNILRACLQLEAAIKAEAQLQQQQVQYFSPAATENPSASVSPATNPSVSPAVSPASDVPSPATSGFSVSSSESALSSNSGVPSWLTAYIPPEYHSYNFYPNHYAHQQHYNEPGEYSPLS